MQLLYYRNTAAQAALARPVLWPAARPHAAVRCCPRPHAWPRAPSPAPRARVQPRPRAHPGRPAQAPTRPPHPARRTPPAAEQARTRAPGRPRRAARMTLGTNGTAFELGKKKALTCADGAGEAEM